MLVSSLCPLRDTYLVLCAQGANPLEMLFAEELHSEKELFLMTVLCRSNVKVFVQQRYVWLF